MGSAHRLANLLTIFLLIGVLGGMAVLTLLGAPDVESLARENRRPSALPNVPANMRGLKKIPGEFDAYFTDRLAMRESLLNLHALIKTDGLGVSSSEKVTLGREGWLFLNEAAESGSGKSSAEQLADWHDSFRRRGQWLAARGINYLFVIAPEKHTVYPELLHIPPSQPSPARSLAGRERNNPMVLDLLPALQCAKCEQQVYFHSDTHWNDDGAYAAYVAIVRKLGEKYPAMKPLPRERFEARRAEFVGDLGKMLHLQDPPTEEAVSLSLRDRRARRLDVDVPLDPRLHSPAHIPPQAWGTGDPTLPRGVIFHDSFAERLLLPLLAEHFEVLAFAPSASLDPAVIDRFKPDIVIQQVVERKINRHQPLLPPGFGK